MLKRCLRVGCEDGILVNRLPMGYEESRHVMSWREERNTDQQPANFCVPLVLDSP
jgi:hypothetical protein